LGRPAAGPAGRHCLCTHLGDQELGPGAELTGFTTFARLPAGVPAVTVTAPRFGTFTGVPVVRGALPGVRVDATGFAVAGIDRLPYATVLRVRRNPIQAGHALARPEPLATTPRTPQAAGEVVLVDPATLTSYTARYRDDGGCLCANFTGAYPEIGVYVFPPLPPSAGSLRVWYTGGLPVDDVAVSATAAPAGGAPYAPWPAARPAQSEVAHYPRHDEAVFDAVAERDGLRRELRSGQATVLFDVNSATVRPRARTALRRLAAELSARPGIRTIQVTGNTDLAGTESYNLELSGRRARAVARLLDLWISRSDVAFTVAEIGELAAGAGRPSPAERALDRTAVISLA
jgi:outer membrane protein OmpA-like peptidoglycan-associated protein